MPTDNSYNFLIAQLDAFIRRYELNRLIKGLIYTGAALCLALLIIGFAEYWGHFGTIVRGCLFYSFIILSILLIYSLILSPMLARLNIRQTLTHNEAAEIISRRTDGIHDRLINTLQLQQLVTQKGYSHELIAAGIHQNIDALNPALFPYTINLRDNRKPFGGLLFLLTLMMITCMVAPAVMVDSTKRVFHHNKYFVEKAPFQFIVINGNLKTIQGSDLKLEIKLRGNHLPEDVYVEIGNQAYHLNKSSINHFSYTFTNVQENIKFRLSANGYSSALYKIEVVHKPVIIYTGAHLIYPPYLRRKADSISSITDITVPEGTTIRYNLLTKNTQGILFQYDAYTTTQTDKINTNRFQYELSAKHNLNGLFIPYKDETMRGDSVTHRITVVADEAPVITAERQTDSASIKSSYFNGTIADDHGFTSLSFYIRIIPADKTKKTIVLKKKVITDLSRNQATYFYYLNTAILPAMTGSTLNCYFEIADNDAVNGPKHVRSQEFVLRMPNTQQINAQLDAGSQAVKQQLQSAINMAGKLQQDVRKIDQSLFNKNVLSYDEHRQLESLLQKRNELNQMISNVQRENKKNTYLHQENQQQTAELSSKQGQMEQLMAQLLDNKTKQMLDRLEAMLQQNKKEEIRDNLSAMQSDNQSLKKDLNRVLELYKKLEFDQKLDQQIKQIQQLAQQQKQLADKTGNKNSSIHQLQSEQQHLQQDFGKLKRDLKELEKTSAQIEQSTGYQNPEQQSRKVEEQMRNGTAQLQKDNKTGAQQAQQQAASQLEQMANQLQQQGQENEGQQNQINLQQLRELIKNLVNSSFNQEKLLQHLRSTSSNSPAYSILAQNQKDIRDNIKITQDSLYSLSRRVPQLQSAVSQEVISINTSINQSLALMEDRHTAEAVQQQQQTMMAMNNLALLLSEAANQIQRMMKNAKPGGGKKQGGLSQLSQQQQQLNQHMQRMREQMQQQGNQGKSASAIQSEQLARMARQQQMIRQALEKYNREEVSSGNAGARELNKIAKAMEQTEGDIVNKNLTSETLVRQQQIHTRLLEADKADQQQEQEKQRESNTGHDYPPGYIKALRSYQQQQAKQTEQLQTVPPALNLYFKQRVKNYFDQLNAH